MFPMGAGARGDFAAYVEGVGRMHVDVVATEPAAGAGDVDVDVQLHDLGVVFEGAKCHVTTAIDYAPGATMFLELSWSPLAAHFQT